MNKNNNVAAVLRDEFNTKHRLYILWQMLTCAKAFLMSMALTPQVPPDLLSNVAPQVAKMSFFHSHHKSPLCCFCQLRKL